MVSISVSALRPTSSTIRAPGLLILVLSVAVLLPAAASAFLLRRALPATSAAAMKQAAARSSSSANRLSAPGRMPEQKEAAAEKTPARPPLVAAVPGPTALALDLVSSQQLLRDVRARVAAALRLRSHELPVVKAPGREGVRVDRREHFEADAVTTARWLLGSRLVRMLPDGRRLSGRIVEVEAYLGVHDAAAHSFRAKRTAKNEAMYKAGGTAYLYQCHMYHCMNVICGRVDEPTGVLIRALEPEEGIEEMLEHRLQRKGALGPTPPGVPALTDAQRARLLAELAAGPGRMCMALGMDRELNGACLREGPHLFLEHGDHVEEQCIAVSGRVGVEYAEEWARAPLRFAVKDSKHVSKPWPWAGGAKQQQEKEQQQPDTAPGKGKGKGKGAKRKRA